MLTTAREARAARAATLQGIEEVGVVGGQCMCMCACACACARARHAHRIGAWLGFREVLRC